MCHNIVTHVNGSVGRNLKGARRIRSLELSSPHKRSITTPVLKDDVRENSVSEYFLATSLEIWPLSRFFFGLFGNNASDNAITLPELDGVSRAKPGF